MFTPTGNNGHQYKYNTQANTNTIRTQTDTNTNRLKNTQPLWSPPTPTSDSPNLPEGWTLTSMAPSIGKYKYTTLKFPCAMMAITLLIIHSKPSCWWVWWCMVVYGGYGGWVWHNGVRQGIGLIIGWPGKRPAQLWIQIQLLVTHYLHKYKYEYKYKWITCRSTGTN